MKKRIDKTKKQNTRWNAFFIVLTMIFTLNYIIFRIFFTIPEQKGTISIICWAVLLISECIGLFEMAVHFYNMYVYDKIELKTPKMYNKKYPEIDVLIPTINEDPSLLEKTLCACKQMEYPQKNKVHIYVCDDGNREEVKALADKLKINYIAREEHKDAKAGNLNHAMKQSSSPYIAVFDADMIPKSQFLMKTVPWFTKKDTGFVQTPQNFYEPDLFQYNLYAKDHIPNEQDYFYKVVQISKNKTNSVILGGSNMVLSRKVLEEIGGFVTGVVTEDFATGIEIEKKGYQGIAIPEVLASGIPPMTFTELIGQRRRWAKGCIQSGKKTKFLSSKGLNFFQKINYVTAIGYWYTAMKRWIYFIAPLLFAFFGIVVVECRLYQILIFWLPMYLSVNLCMRRFSRNIRTTKWTDIYETTLAPWLLPTVLMTSIGKTKNTFRVTDKSEKNGNNSRLCYLIPYLIGIALLIIGIIRIVGRSGREETYTYGIVLFWLILNLYFMIMASYVTLGRIVGTGYYLQKIEEKAIFVSQEKEYQLQCKSFCDNLILAETLQENQKNLSSQLAEGNLCLKVMDDTEIILPVKLLEIKDNLKYLYEIEWKNVNDDIRKQYIQFLYDRPPILPQQLKRKGRLDECITVLIAHLTNE